MMSKEVTAPNFGEVVATKGCYNGTIGCGNLSKSMSSSRSQHLPLKELRWWAHEDSLLGICWLLLVWAEFIARACCSLFPSISTTSWVLCWTKSSGWLWLSLCWPRHRQEQGDLRWMKQHQCWQHCYWCSTLAVTGRLMGEFHSHPWEYFDISSQERKCSVSARLLMLTPVDRLGRKRQKTHWYQPAKAKNKPGKMAITDCYSS